MTQPRRIVAGSTYFITRRCTERRHLLRPDPQVTTALAFCLAEAARRTGVLVHGYVAMSNHYHLIVTDVRGVLPDFMAWLNRHSAHCLKRYRKRQGDFWESSEKYSCVLLTTEQALWDKLAYLVLNPVSAHLVASAQHWPGLISLPSAVLKPPLTVKRPLVYFRDGGPVPKHSYLQLSVPPMLERLYSKEDYVAMWQRLVAERQQQAAMLRGSRPVLGVNKLLRIDPYSTPRSVERRGQRNPVVAAVTADGLHKAHQRLRSFHRLYRKAYIQLRSRAPEQPPVLFPAGTWWWVRYGAQRAAAV